MSPARSNAPGPAPPRSATDRTQGESAQPDCPDAEGAGLGWSGDQPCSWPSKRRSKGTDPENQRRHCRHGSIAQGKGRGRNTGGNHHGHQCRWPVAIGLSGPHLDLGLPLAQIIHEGKATLLNRVLRSFSGQSALVLGLGAHAHDARACPLRFRASRGPSFASVRLPPRRCETRLTT